MWEKIFKFFLKYILPVCLFFIIAIFSKFIPYFSYLFIFIGYVLFNYYLFFINIRIGKGPKKKNTIYYWLDNLDGSDVFLKKLFVHEKNKDILSNLDFVLNKFKSITGNDIKQMKLLRGYFRAINQEGPEDLFFKTVLGIIVAVIAWGINRGYFLNLSRFKSSLSSLGINPDIFTGLNLATLVFQGLLFFAIIIADYFKNKKRTKVIIEILDICIEEMDYES